MLGPVPGRMALLCSRTGGQATLSLLAHDIASNQLLHDLIGASIDGLDTRVHKCPGGERERDREREGERQREMEREREMERKGGTERNISSEHTMPVLDQLVKNTCRAHAQ